MAIQGVKARVYTQLHSLMVVKGINKLPLFEYKLAEERISHYAIFTQGRNYNQSSASFQSCLDNCKMELLL